MLYRLISEENRETLIQSQYQSSDVSGVLLRTVYQKIYLPKSQSDNPSKWITSNLLEEYYEKKVEKVKDYVPVGAVFNTILTHNGEFLEDYPVYTHLNKRTKNCKQDLFQKNKSFQNCLEKTVKAMMAFDFFERYNLTPSTFLEKVATSYGHDYTRFYSE